MSNSFRIFFIDKCTDAEKSHYFYYFKVEDEKLICAIYGAKPEKLLSDFSSIISKLQV